MLEGNQPCTVAPIWVREPVPAVYRFVPTVEDFAPLLHLIPVLQGLGNVPVQMQQLQQAMNLLRGEVRQLDDRVAVVGNRGARDQLSVVLPRRGPAPHFALPPMNIFPRTVADLNNLTAAQCTLLLQFYGLPVGVAELVQEKRRRLALYLQVASGHV